MEGPEFVVEEPDLSACIVTVLAPGTLGFCISCDDSFYGWADFKPVPLGRFLRQLGLTAADCARALEADA